MIDSHCHLADPKYDADRADVLKRAKSSGVEAMVVVGTDLEDSRRVLEVASAEDHLFAVAGVHPHEASTWEDHTMDGVKALWENPKVVAAGEMGLDYHYDFSPREQQKQVFAAQLEAAAEARLPCVIHTREADEDTVALIRAAPARDDLPGVIHCFTGNQALADACLAEGYFISFSGIVTFKNAQELREVAASVPADRLLIETDSPYLAPVPFRGKRNEPGHVKLVAQCLGEVRGEDWQQLAETCAANTRRLFHRMA